MTEDPRHAASDMGTEEYPAAAANAGVEPDEPWWKRSGYSSFQAYLDEVETRNRNAFRPSLDVEVSPPPSPNLPKRPENPDMRVRQVNVKLGGDEYDALALVAASYAVAPSTMARMLVRRGVRAALDEVRAERPESDR